MRLTLRNLLAYLHDAMSPEDRAAFDALVQGSPRVQALIDRCRTLPQKQIAAPALDQASAHHTAEAVANYLDFTLADDQLATFEKAALASDEQLAEIAACHAVLADITQQRVTLETPAWKSRLLALPEEPRADKIAAAHEPQQQVAGLAKEALSAATKAERANADSGELDNYLSASEDDDEELSIDAIQERAERVQQEAVAAAASAYGSGRGTTTAPRMSIYGSRGPFQTAPAPMLEPYVEAEPIPLDGVVPKKPLPVPLIAGAAGGGVLVLGLLIWVAASIFSSSDTVAHGGPHIYGIYAAAGTPTCEIMGTIQHRPGGGAPLPDDGALVLAWPVQDPGNVNRLTADVVRELVAEKRQSPYNELLVVAQTDEQGRYRLRMFDCDEVHVMVLSRRSTTNNPKTWTETVDALKVHLDDPVTLIGRSNYWHKQHTIPANKLLTLDYVFEE